MYHKEDDHEQDLVEFLHQGTPRNMKVFFITLREAIEGVPGIPQAFIFNAMVTHLDHFARGKEYMSAFCICERTLAAEYNVNALHQTQHWPYDREVYEVCLINVALKPKSFAINLLVLARAGEAGLFDAMYLLTGEVVRGTALSSHLGALMRLPHAESQAGWEHYVQEQRDYRGVIEVLSKMFT